MPFYPPQQPGPPESLDSKILRFESNVRAYEELVTQLEDSLEPVSSFPIEPRRYAIRPSTGTRRPCPSFDELFAQSVELGREIHERSGELPEISADTMTPEVGAHIKQMFIVFANAQKRAFSAIEKYLPPELPTTILFDSSSDSLKIHEDPLSKYESLVGTYTTAVSKLEKIISSLPLSFGSPKDNTHPDLLHRMLADSIVAEKEKIQQLSETLGTLSKEIIALYPSLQSKDHERVKSIATAFSKGLERYKAVLATYLTMAESFQQLPPPAPPV